MTFKNKRLLVGLIHRVYLNFLKNKRKYRASTKTKGEVRGGGRKPWRQKGTGNARAGSIRSPLWVGGGVIFGPKFRIVNKKTNKKENQLAKLSALYLKNKDIIILDQNLFDTFNSNKTKSFILFCKQFNLNLSLKNVFVLPYFNENFLLASQNIRNVLVLRDSQINIETLLKNKYLIFSNLSISKFRFIYDDKK